MHWTLENILTVVGLAFTAIGFAIGLFTTIAKLSKNKKLMQAAEKASKIYEVAQDVVISAEALVSKGGEQMSGAAKKEYAMNAANTALTQMGFELDDSTLQTIDNAIENMVKLSKAVNAKVKANSTASTRKT